MASNSPAEETSDRKRISIPKVDASVLEWWEMQHDVGLSVRMLIRAEIERNGFSDVAYRPVAQQPRRGRPPGSGNDHAGEADDEPPASEPPAAIAKPTPAPAIVADPPPAREPELVAAGGMNPIDAIMNL